MAQESADGTPEARYATLAETLLAYPDVAPHRPAMLRSDTWFCFGRL